MKKLAALPEVMLPKSALNPMAQAPLSVAGMDGLGGGSSSCGWEARETTMRMFPEGDEPGL